ncbi:hypothetical protein Poly21_39400 [Allorhodopirellula heiligendammensis]|uniref:Uncharacterized protein n=1 Tax=Allorhodopirellula heiligendammensis TaxID=2714739 RepID=A0A5C6C0P8_9BACT|nr:hypothetical protein Poly21_39400 [Allorhodopirellula heiligendammensis]
MNFGTMNAAGLSNLNGLVSIAFDSARRANVPILELGRATYEDSTLRRDSCLGPCRIRLRGRSVHMHSRTWLKDPVIQQSVSSLHSLLGNSR